MPAASQQLRKHIPSLTHLSAFALARQVGRPHHVVQDKRQVTSSADSRFFAFAYERFITGVIRYVNDGCRGNAMRLAIEAAPARMRGSYEAAAKGMESVFPALRPTRAQRRQKNLIVADELGESLVSFRVHLMVDLQNGGRAGVFMYFPARTLTAIELEIVETSIAMGLNQVDPVAKPTLILVRSGKLRAIGPEALLPHRVSQLREASDAYRAEWAAVS